MKIICPKCKSKNIISIVYGYPSSELFELSEQVKVKFGGCEEYLDICNQTDFVRIDIMIGMLIILNVMKSKKYVLNSGKISVVQILKKKTSGFMTYIQMAKLSIVPIL